MLRLKLKWYLLFEHRDELEALFQSKELVTHKSMLGHILFVKEKNEILAFKNRCPHQNKPLDGAWLEDGYIVCPFHQYHFSCENGRGHGLCLDKFQLKFEDNQVFLGKEVWTLF